MMRARTALAGTAIALSALLNGNIIANDNYEPPQLPPCRCSIPITPGDVPLNFFSKTYKVHGSYLLWSIEGEMGTGKVDIEITGGRRIKGSFDQNNVNLHYSGTAHNYDINGRFNGIKGSFCRHEAIDGTLRNLDPVVGSFDEVRADNHGRYLAKFHIHGLPCNVILQLEELDGN